MPYEVLVMPIAGFAARWKMGGGGGGDLVL